MRDLTPEERLRVVASVCRSALQVLALNPKWEAVLAARDEAESTRRALHRLRRP